LFIVHYAYLKSHIVNILEKKHVNHHPQPTSFILLRLAIL
jgi:hypothetical protein